MLTRNLADLGEGLLSLGGEVKSILTAVVGIRLSLQQATALQFVEDGDQTAGVDTKFGGKVLLTNALSYREQAENSGIGRCQSDGREAFTEFRGRMGPDLSQQESRPGRLSGNVHESQF
jgi:hypothetical protein